jgi:hypothetical protein
MARHRKKKRNAFSEAEVREHFSRRHPGCPAEAVERYIQCISQRRWNPPLTLGHAAGMIATNDVRHRLTDYDQLLRVPGLTREEARLIVASEVKQTIALWAAPAPGKPPPTSS